MPNCNGYDTKETLETFPGCDRFDDASDFRDGAAEN